MFTSKFIPLDKNKKIFQIIWGICVFKKLNRCSCSIVSLKWNIFGSNLNSIIACYWIFKMLNVSYFLVIKFVIWQFHTCIFCIAIILTSVVSYTYHSVNLLFAKTFLFWSSVLFYWVTHNMAAYTFLRPTASKWWKHKVRENEKNDQMTEGNINNKEDFKVLVLTTCFIRTLVTNIIFI